MKQFGPVFTFIGVAIFLWLGWKLMVTGYYPDEVGTLVLIGIDAFALVGAGDLIRRQVEKERKTALLEEFEREDLS